MISFNIQKPDTAITTALQDKIDNLTKPKGSLGTLEEIALQIGLIQQTLSPVLHHPVNVIYASDHGIADEGVSKSPKEVTRQVIHNFLNGGAGICFLSRQHGFEIKIVDGGVDFDFPAIPELIDRKIRKGTRNFLYEAAMTQDEMELAIQYGADIVTDCYDKGSNVISFGEMGIGNTAASSMWMTCLTGIPLIDCVGAGSGLDNEGVKHKYNVLRKALENYKGDNSTLDVIRYFGGYEMVVEEEESDHSTPARKCQEVSFRIHKIVLLAYWLLHTCIRKCFPTAYSDTAETRPDTNVYWISYKPSRC